MPQPGSAKGIKNCNSSSPANLHIERVVLYKSYMCMLWGLIRTIPSEELLRHVTSKVDNLQKNEHMYIFQLSRNMHMLLTCIFLLHYSKTMLNVNTG